MNLPEDEFNDPVKTVVRAIRRGRHTQFASREWNDVQYKLEVLLTAFMEMKEQMDDIQERMAAAIPWEEELEEDA